MLLSAYHHRKVTSSESDGNIQYVYQEYQESPLPTGVSVRVNSFIMYLQLSFSSLHFGVRLGEIFSQVNIFLQTSLSK